MSHRPRHLGVLQVEPTDLCDLACAMCAPQRDRSTPPHGVPRGFLAMPVFEAILDGLAADDARFDHVLLQWMGEPALHPDLPGLVGRAAAGLRDRASYLRVDTNGIRLDPDRMDALVDAWLPHRTLPLLLVFSVDAITPGTYAQVKGRDAFHTVVRNLRHLLLRRRTLARRLPNLALNVQVQLVLQDGNAAEAGAFVDGWSALFACLGQGGGCNEILVKRLSVDGGGPGQDAADRLYDLVRRTQRLAAREAPPARVVLWEDRPWERDDGHPVAPRGPCPGPWLTPVIRHDGVLTVCCADLRGQLALGRPDREGFLRLWEGEEADALRQAHLDGGYPGPCAACGGIAWYRLDPDDLQAPARRCRTRADARVR